LDVQFKNLDALSRAMMSYFAVSANQIAVLGINLPHISIPGGVLNAPLHQRMSLSSI
jgi:hypothetical protein